MRRARHSGRPLSNLLVAFTIALFATAALALPPRAEAAIHLGSPNTVSLTNGLVGYWPLDGQTVNWATGKAKDISGNANDGSLALMSTSSSPSAGKIGQGLSSNGTGYTRVSNPSVTSFLNFTVSLWVKPNAKVDTQGIFDMRSATMADVLDLYGMTNVRLYMEDVDQDVLTIGDVLKVGQWTHITVTRSGSNIIGYVDGVATANGTSAANVSGVTYYALGSQAPANPDQIFDGTIDDVRIYNRALSAAEIKQLYNLGTAKIGHSNIAISNGLVGYWTFDGKDTNWATGQTKDLSGQGNSGQLRSMSTSTSVVSGKIGQSFKFDGTSGYVDVGDISAGDFGTADFSITFWYKAPPGTDGYFLNKRAVCGHANFWNIYVSGNPGSVGIEFDEDAGGTHYGSVDPGTDAIVNDNKWHQIVFIRKGSYVAEFVDGGLAVSDDPGFITNLSNSASLTVGGNNPCGGVSAGSLDDIRIYNRALSATEIKQLYNSSANTVGHSNTIISNGLVGYWTFDGGSIDWHTNTVADMSSQGNTGSLISMSTTSSPVPGKIGQAFKFNGSSNVITTAISFDDPQPYTVSIWFKTTVASGHKLVGFENVQTGTAAYYDRHIYMGTDSKIYFGWYDPYLNELNFVSSVGALTDGKWHHAVGTHDGTNGKLYIDGVLQGTGTGPSQSFTGWWRIGGYTLSTWSNGSNGYFEGALDDVRVYNRALSATEVKQLYNAGR